MKLFFLIIFSINIFAVQNNYIINHSGLIDIRTLDKINQIGLEIYTKTNTQIYLDVKGNNGINLKLARNDRINQMKMKEKKLLKKIKEISKTEFVILTISVDQKYTNILYSNEDLKSIVLKDDILDDYVIPLLAAKDKNLLKSKVSAAVLNGYAQIADEIASTNNIVLKSSIGSAGKTASTIWRVFMYTLVVFGIIAYIFIILRQKKYKNGNE